MKTQLLLLSVLFLTALTQNTNAQNFEWANQIGGIENDAIESIKVDANGNVYTVGIFHATVDFDPGPGNFNLTAMNADTYITKQDASGKLVWAKQFSGPINESPYSLAIDAENNLFITGVFSDTVDFDPGPGTYYLSG